MRATRRVLVFLALAAGLVVALPASQPADASHGNFNVHVHDDYYHPVGAFLVSGVTDHGIARAVCETGDPPSDCDAVIHAGDTITWVAPPPLAVNVHTVTECTDNSFSVCGPAVSAGNPIGDSGLRQPPPAVAPTGFPYGPIMFSTPGTYYYRCEVHPAVMRGRVIVLEPAAVGGEGAFAGATDAGGAAAPTTVAIAAGAAGVLVFVVALSGAAWRVRRRRARSGEASEAERT
jgi:plastocyanin